MHLRCFVSLEIPDELKKKISEQTEPLRATGADVRWVSEKNLHITLKFLGATDETLVPKIGEKLREATSVHSPFSITLRGTGVFPNERHPRVVWIAIEDSEQLLALQADVERAMKALGFEAEDKRFEPHLTIGRLRSERYKDALLKEIALMGRQEFGIINVNSISLMQSRLSPKGSDYSRLIEVPLGR